MNQPAACGVTARSLVLMCLAIVYQTLNAQTVIIKDSSPVNGSTVVIPGKEYKRSGYHNFWWGKHYRKEWATPVRVNNFYLDTAEGGLIPSMEAGAREPRTLRLKNSRGKEYVLRSVNKGFGKWMTGMKGTFVGRVAKDQLSMGHPFGAYIITPLIEAAGIYHTNPRIVFVPKQEALQGYNEGYGDQLYLFEERPDEDQSDVASFGSAENVIGTEKLFEKVYDENDNTVDQVAFLRARLFDMVIGDWGRQPDNWRWAEFDLGKQTIYKPVPRDRDKAYAKIDGFYPDLIGAFRPQIQGFGNTVKNIGRWNFSARQLDQKFLNELALDIWIQQAEDLKRVLTDSLIESSVRRMPPELFSISGEEIISKLKSRRDALPEYARKYYAYLAKTVTILGSEKKELIKVGVLNEDSVNVNVFKINKEGKLIDTPYYSRAFHAAETNELFIYGLDRADHVAVGGEQKSKIKIHIIDPQNKDSVYADNSRIKGIKFFTGGRFEYDTLRDQKVRVSILPILTPTEYTVYNDDPLRLFARTGIKVSAGVAFTPQPWRRKEYQIVHSIYALYGFLRTSFNVGYVGRFAHTVGKWDLLLKARLDKPAVENYFGAGNETKLETAKRNFYRTLSERHYTGIGIQRNFKKMHHAEMSLIYHAVQYKKDNTHNIGIAPDIDPSVFSLKRFAGLETVYNYDHTDGDLCPRHGFTFRFGGGFLRNLADTGSTFAKFNAAAAVYLPLGPEFILAVRAGGGILVGDPDFYHLNRLGGNVELRGFERERFYGKSVFYTNTELRWVRDTRNFLFNGRAGLIGFYDIGRVWIPGERSNLWHAGYGIGLVAIPINKVTLTATYGLTKEGDNLFFRAEWFF